MKIEGRPKYNANSIEVKSKKLLTTYSPDYFATIKPTPLLSIVDFLKTTYYIFFDFEVNLGFSADNSRMLGACNPIKKVILIDSSLKSDEHKFNFTLAHELGHLALHRGVKITHAPDDNINIETVNETPIAKTGFNTESEWMEWQANYYASALLMPDNIFTSKLVQIQKQLGARIGKIYVDKQPCNQQRLYEIIGMLGGFFHVSFSAAKYRLNALKLIDDKRKEHIKDYL